MGYFAITSKQPLEVAKSSETIFIKRSTTYTFYEIEVVHKDSRAAFKRGEYEITLIIPGEIFKFKDGHAIHSVQEFLPWYYSQKTLNPSGNGNRFEMNGKHTKIVDPIVTSTFDPDINISKLNVKFIYDDAPSSVEISSIHLFFTAACKGQVIRQNGNIYLESRYFDKKLCPKGNYFDTQVLPNCPIYVKRIYCWFIVPKGFIASDYSDFEHQPRDSRIIEPEYNILLNNLNFVRKKLNLFTDWLMGRPQVINWVINEDKITFNQNHEQFGKWDEIRLFVSCTGFPISTFFWYTTGVSSVIGLLVAILTLR